MSEPNFGVAAAYNIPDELWYEIEANLPRPGYKGHPPWFLPFSNRIMLLFRKYDAVGWKWAKIMLDDCSRLDGW